MPAPLLEFAENLRQKFASHVQGEPEDQLRAPFERLLTEAGREWNLQVLAIGETLLSNRGGKPDFGISVDNLLCGHAELKAPGKGADPSRYTGHDARQWSRFRNLPNLIYTDGREFALYRYGIRVRVIRLSENPVTHGASAVDTDDQAQFCVLLRDFLLWEPIVPGTSKQLAEFLAPLCRTLRDDVLDALRANAPGVTAAASDWRRYLFPGADDEHFADAYAQTVTFALLLARSNGSDTLFLDHAIATLTHANTLLSRALQVLTDPLVKEHLSTSLGLLQRVINAVPTGTMTGGRRDPWLHFYEDFLAVYDPELRKDAGAYYTPVEVVQAQVRIVDDLLRTRMGKRQGWASGGVNVLDPAVGTGTYLLGIAEHALARVAEEEGPGAVPARADVLANSLYGFEIMVGPYAVAALRLTRMLQQYGSDLPGDGVQVMLTNTLESPHEKIPELPLLYRQIGLEHKRAKRVKETVPIMVCIGNPPYDRHAAVTEDNKVLAGGWVRWGESKSGQDAILNDFIAPVKAAGHGGDLKNLYNLYVYFWRWALWKTFEHDLALGPGVVTYITASSFIDGDAFLGMRRHMRELCDEIWVIDLGGEGRGTRKDENVFAIKTPVAITIAARYGHGNRKKPAKTNYVRITGSRAEKLQQLENLNSLNSIIFEQCPDTWESPFRPSKSGTYFDWPLLTDLIPWQHSGVEAKRTWPIGMTRDTVTKRWNILTSEKDRANFFRESSDRLVTETYDQFVDFEDGNVSISRLKAGAKSAPPTGFALRTLDRHSILPDARLIARPRPQLWSTQSRSQLFFATLSTDALDFGPAISVCADIPDRHFFCGRGGKDIYPLFRDAAATQPNLHPQLQSLLSNSFGRTISVNEIAAYIYAILAQPAFTSRFHSELETRELRVPLTENEELFSRASLLGCELLFLHTYGERFEEGQEWPAPVVKNLSPVPSGRMPERFNYDPTRRILTIDGGEFGPVAPEVWNYQVSGLFVVQSWLGYRMKQRKGKKSSPLDDITPTEWGSEVVSELLRLLNLLTRTIALHTEQERLLDEILAGPMLTADDLGEAPPAWRKAPKDDGVQQTLRRHDED